ncbi:molybdopterin-dependent oxidoreductase [Marivita sp.]|uniref:molybdopterin-dependent oxidoreductase n=1 Tax=Marivita sp. TaxID=2003365 RepID=UPI0025C1F2E4|nr:molybdopterin-dependent oxidoreductase [Marivita sp.]
MDQPTQATACSLTKSVAARVFMAAWLVWASTGASAAEGDLPVPSGEVLLRVDGGIARHNTDGGAALDREMLAALPRATLETRTVVTDGVRHFTGFYMRDLLDLLGAEGETVVATALNDYEIEIPREDFRQFDVIVATHMDGARLEPWDKGPLWIVYPRDDHAELQDLRYDYRWVWQLTHLEIQ